MDSEELFGPRQSIRLPGFDYAQAGAYFLTICTYRKQCFFSQIRDNAVALTALGQVVTECWLAIPKHFPHAVVPVHVVMPNHLHGIVMLRKRANCRLETSEAFQTPAAGSIPTLVRSLKAAVTLCAKRAGLAPLLPIWQQNYFERALRDGKEYASAERYILENPMRWHFDDENPQNHP